MNLTLMRRSYRSTKTQLMISLYLKLLVQIKTMSSLLFSRNLTQKERPLRNQEASLYSRFMSSHLKVWMLQWQHLSLQVVDGLHLFHRWTQQHQRCHSRIWLWEQRQESKLVIFKRKHTWHSLWLVWMSRRNISSKQSGSTNGFSSVQDCLKTQ